jgi:hypothetical protein
MHCEMFVVLRRYGVALALLGMVAGATAAQAPEEPIHPAPPLAQQSLEALPGRLLAVMVVHNLGECEQVFRRPLQQFGLPSLPVDTFIRGLEGSDPSGPLLLGLAESADGPPTMFLMIPISDFSQFVTGLGGEAEGDSSEIELAGQRLQASDRGNWALVSNVATPLGDERYQPAPSLLRAAAPYFADERRGSLSLLVPGDGLARMATAVKESGKTPAEIDRLRRMFRVSDFRWNQPADWQELILVYGPLVESLASHTAGAAVQVQVTVEGNARVDGSLLAPETTGATTGIEATKLPALKVPDRAAFLTFKGPAKTPWTPMAVELFLGHLASRGDDLGVVEYPPDEWEAFRQSVHSLVGEVSGISVTAVAPAGEEPQLANQAVLLEVDDSQQFLQTAQELTTDWNRLVENSRHEVDLVFDARPLEIEGVSGTRFAVDLPTAFQANQIPEVRNVLTALFGNTGEMQIDVLPLDATHVLVSQFPPELTSKIVTALKPLSEGDPAERWNVRFAPQVFQDWQNATFKASFDANIIGWKPRRFESAETITATVTPSSEAARVELELSPEVLEAWAKFLSAKRR